MPQDQSFFDKSGKKRKSAPKSKGKSTLEKLRGKVRKAMTLFGAGSAAIEGNVTPGIQAATKKAQGK